MFHVPQKSWSCFGNSKSNCLNLVLEIPKSNWKNDVMVCTVCTTTWKNRFRADRIGSDDVHAVYCCDGAVEESFLLTTPWCTKFAINFVATCEPALTKTAGNPRGAWTQAFWPALAAPLYKIPVHTCFHTSPAGKYACTFVQPLSRTGTTSMSEPTRNCWYTMLWTCLSWG